MVTTEVKVKTNLKHLVQPSYLGYWSRDISGANGTGDKTRRQGIELDINGCLPRPRIGCERFACKRPFASKHQMRLQPAFPAHPLRQH